MRKRQKASHETDLCTCLEENDIQSNLIFTDVSSWQASRNKVYERHSFKKKYPRERERLISISLYYCTNFVLFSLKLGFIANSKDERK